LTQIYGIDAASFQGRVNWAVVDSLCDFGAEKVTEGAGYINPFWAEAKPAMLARARQTGFVPIAYLFLDANSSGSAQASWFAKQAGDLGGFGIVVDVERSSTGSPTRFQTARCVSQLRKLYPHHRIGGYAPRWFTAGWKLSFFDWIWASSYVSGSGDPVELVKSVPAGWWDAYGSMKPEVLQFTSSGVVPGVSGPVDCSVFMGTRPEFAALALPPAKAPPVKPVTPPPPPASPPGAAPVIPAKQPVSKTAGHAVTIMQLLPASPAVHLPVWLPLPKSIPEPYRYFAMQLSGDAGAQVKIILHMSDGTLVPKVKTLEAGKVTEVMPEQGWSVFEKAEVSRLDGNRSLAATLRVVTW
jgi:lysozyme